VICCVCDQAPVWVDQSVKACLLSHRRFLLFQGSFWSRLDVAVSCIFLLDVAACFNVGFAPGNGDAVVIDRLRVSLRYLRTWFACDLVAALPLEAAFLPPRYRNAMLSV
jgi:hypothetical protein